MDILVNVVGQKMKIATNFRNLVAGSQNFVRFCFCLDNAWDGLTNTARFTQGSDHYDAELDLSNRCFLPPEIGVGKCTIALCGTGTNDLAEDEVVATTDCVEITIASCPIDTTSINT